MVYTLVTTLLSFHNNVVEKKCINVTNQFSVWEPNKIPYIVKHCAHYSTTASESKYDTCTLERKVHNSSSQD